MFAPAACRACRQMAEFRALYYFSFYFGDARGDSFRCSAEKIGRRYFNINGKYNDRGDADNAVVWK